MKNMWTVPLFAALMNVPFMFVNYPHNLLNIVGFLLGISVAIWMFRDSRKRLDK